MDYVKNLKLCEVYSRSIIKITRFHLTIRMKERDLITYVDQGTESDCKVVRGTCDLPEGNCRETQDLLDLTPFNYVEF